MKKLQLIFILFAGCSHVTTLKQGAERTVSIVRYIPDSDLSKMNYLGETFCEYGFNGNFRSSNEMSCRNEMVNDTYEEGGNILLLKEIRGNSNICNNCVEGYGLMFKGKLK